MECPRRTWPFDDPFFSSHLFYGAIELSAKGRKYFFTQVGGVCQAKSIVVSKCPFHTQCGLTAKLYIPSRDSRRMSYEPIKK